MRVTFPGSVTGDLVLQRGSATGLTPPTPLGAMRLPNISSAPFGSTMPYATAAMLDADADGDLDLAVAPGGSRPWLRLTQGANGAALAATALPFAAERLHSAPRDIDGDGDVDLLSATSEFGTIAMWLHRNDGRGRFGPEIFAGSYPGSGLIGGAWADFDNNGSEDLWIPALLPGLPSTILLNDGAGRFAPGTTVLPGSAAALAVADFTGDGFQDIVFARNIAPGPGVTFQRPVLLRGIPTPGGVAFAPAVPFGTAELITDLAVFDANRDGDLDLLCGTQVNNNPNGPARIYDNDGSGNFTGRPSIPGTQAQTVAVGDLNHDGRPDLVVGDQSWTSRGPNLFFQGTHVQPSGLISLADLDEDGELDLYDSAGQWYRGNGSGGFGAPRPIVGYEIGTRRYVSSPRAPMDFDSDGDLDVLGPRTFLPGHLAIYSNLTRHAASESLATPGQPLALAVHGRAGDPWLLATSLPTNNPTALPPLGTLFLDQSSAAVVALGTVPANGKSQLTVPIPNAGAGVLLSWQAAIGTPLRFTNGFDTPIGR